MVLGGGGTYGLIRLFGVVTRRHVVGVEGPELDMAMSVGAGSALLAVLATLMVAVHVLIWGETRRPDLGAPDERRVVNLNLFVFGCGMGASTFGVMTVASDLGDGVLTLEALGVAFAAAMLAWLAADASFAVSQEIHERDARRLAEERRDELRAIVERLGDEGPPTRTAVGRMAGGVGAAAGGGVLAAVILRPERGVEVLDATAAGVAAAVVLGAVALLAVLWSDRRDLANLVLIPAAVVLVLSGGVVAMAPAHDLVDLAGCVGVGFGVPLVGAVASAVRGTGSVRRLVRIWFAWALARAEAGLAEPAAAT